MSNPTLLGEPGSRSHAAADSNATIMVEATMTELLERAIAEIATLPQEQQDAMATWVLEELRDDRRWDEAFSRSASELAALAREARAEHRRGETLPLDLSEAGH
jgi:hypothetical protein